MLDLAFLSDRSSYHQIMIIMEASSNSFLLKQSPVRIKTTSLAIHEEMCPKVLDDVDKIVVELWLISNLLMIGVRVKIHVWRKLLYVIVQEVDID